MCDSLANFPRQSITFSDDDDDDHDDNDDGNDDDNDGPVGCLCCIRSTYDYTFYPDFSVCIAAAD